MLKQSRKKASKGLHFLSDQRPHPSAAKSWSLCNSPLNNELSQCFNVDCIPQVGWRSCAACRGKDLSCGTTRSTGCTYKSSGMLPINNQWVAAIIDESWQVMMRRDPPRKGGQFSTVWYTQVPNSKQSGVSSRFAKRSTVAKVSVACKARVKKVKQVKLWTILAWCLYFFVQNWKCRTSTKGTKVPPSAIATLYHPPIRNEELRLSLLLAHRIANGEKRLVSACASCLPHSAVSQRVPHFSHRITGSVWSGPFSSL